MKIRINKGFCIRMAFFLIVVSESTAMTMLNFHNLIEYMGLSLLIVILFINGIKKRDTAVKNVIHFIILFLGLGIGILLQNMEVVAKIKALIPVGIFILIFTCSEGVIKDWATLRKISYSIIAALVISLLLALLTEQSLFEYNGVGGSIYIGYNGGILYKNYFSSTVLVAFIGIYLYAKFSRIYKRDIIGLFILSVIIFMASSNGTFLMMLVFLIFINLDYLFQLPKRYRGLIVILGSVIGFYVFRMLYISIALNNQNYLYRITGLNNYLNVFRNDTFHMLFGNAELAFAPGNSYTNNVRAVTGWDGTLELSWLGILIKNGMFGIVTYFIIFLRAFISAINEKHLDKKKMIYAILFTTLTSSLVETYIQNVHVIFGIYAFTLMYGYKSAEVGNEK